MGIKQYVKTLYILDPKIRHLCVFKVFEYKYIKRYSETWNTSYISF